MANHNKNNNHFISGASTPQIRCITIMDFPWSTHLWRIIIKYLENNLICTCNKSHQLQVQLPQSHNIQRSLLANSSATNLNAYLRGNRRYSSSGNSNPINDLLTSPKFIKSNKFNSPILHQHQPTAQTSPITNGNPVIDQK